MKIALTGINKQFGRYAALRDVDLTIQSGELLALLGPSGSGKTTLLRVIAGLTAPETGSLEFDGMDATNIPARDRKVGFVFQHYALFRHMTVLDNVAFGLSVRRGKDRPSTAQIRNRSLELLNLVKIDELAQRYPAQLSGGQRQRVALARALAIEPRVLLLDEPFGALDARVRKDLRRWIRHLHDEINLTSVFVTHDQEEALEVADRVVIMSKGQIEQIGTPNDVYETPANPFVFSFLGDTNKIPCTLKNGILTATGIDLALETSDAIHNDGVALVRPHDIQITPHTEGLGKIRHISVIGPTVHLEVSTQPPTLILEISLPYQRFIELGLKIGSRLNLRAERGTVVSQTEAHLAA